MRQPGYYWVKFKHDFEDEARWTVGEYSFDGFGKGQWLLPVESGWYERDSDFEEIDERKILPPMENIEHQPGNKGQCDDNT